MILDSIENLSAYAKLGAGFADAVRFLAENRAESLADGRIEVSENLFVLIQTYETAPTETGKFESHHRYIDLQYLVDGEETVVWQHTARLTKIDENPERDYVFYQGEGMPVPLSAGNFMVFFPPDVLLSSVFLIFIISILFAFSLRKQIPFLSPTSRNSLFNILVSPQNVNRFLYFFHSSI